MNASSCPWEGLEPAVRTFCEQNGCGLLAQPANAISSFAYVLFGIALLRQARRAPVYRWFGWIGIGIGVTSFIYHATSSFMGELLDLGSMYVFSALLLVLNLLRLGRLTQRNWRPFYFVLILVSVVFFMIFPREGIWWFGAQIVGFLISEILCYRRQGSQGASYRDFALAVGIFVVSYGVWLLDYHHVVCLPGNHWLQGHAIWHVLNSSSIYFVARFYSQFIEISKD